MQIPVALVIDVQVAPTGQPFPPAPRQPGAQRLVAPPSQMLPEADPPQLLSVRQAPQLFMRHTGVGTRQSVSTRHPLQVRVGTSQTDRAIGQSALARHSTQDMAVGSHAGVVSVHCSLLVTEQIPQAPVA